MEVAIRDTEAEAIADFSTIAAIHGIENEVGSDGSARGLSAAGPPERVAEYVRAYADLGIDEVLWIFRNPFDLETIRRMPEVRALVG